MNINNFLLLWYMYTCTYLILRQSFFEDFALFVAACITIVANDDAYGVFSFESSSLTSTIQETSGTAVDGNGEYGKLYNYSFIACKA